MQQENLVISVQLAVAEIERAIAEALIAIRTDESPAANDQRMQLLGWRGQAETTLQALINSDLNSSEQELAQWINNLDQAAHKLEQASSAAETISIRLDHIRSMVNCMAQLWRKIL